MATVFVKKIFLNGTIELLTGLHISSFNENFSLGIIDYATMRDPITHQPFIPGSSIKGKLRALLENCAQTEDNGDSNPTVIGLLFGMPAKHAGATPARAIFRDAQLTEESKGVTLPFADLPYTEIKKEASIDRTTGQARPMLVERIPPGLTFVFDVIVTIYEDDPEDQLLQTLFQGLELLQDDYLGGRGSRGYGAVKLHITSIKVKDKDSYTTGSSASDYTDISIPESLQ